MKKKRNYTKKKKKKRLISEAHFKKIKLWGIIIGITVQIVIFLSLIDWSEIFSEKLSVNPVKTELIENRDTFKIMKPKNVDYENIVDEAKFYNLQMIGYVDDIGVRGENMKERLYGMILRALRFKNITRKVEKKYGLPKNILLAMVMQESGGADLLPNSSDDGGLGLCHMQPYMANLFHLKTYKNCTKMRSVKHGRELRKLIKKYNYNRRKLIKYDDRFHPLLNLDAAGRMLAYYMAGKQTESTKIKTAIKGYAGRYNYPKYYKRIVDYQKKLNDPQLIKAVEIEFNKRNPDLKINGGKADFYDYIFTHQQQNRNYGLDNYK